MSEERPESTLKSGRPATLQTLLGRPETTASSTPAAMEFQARGKLPQAGLLLTLLAMMMGVCAGAEIDLYACDFDNNDVCGALLSPENEGWLLNKGSTPTHNTGPEADSNNNPDGYYLHIETSTNVMDVNDEADLIISLAGHSTTGPLHLSFSYHMHGQTMGTLKVMTKDEGGLIQRVFEEVGDQGNWWNRKSLVLDENTREVTIHANKGSGPGFDIYGDIAIDAVVISGMLQSIPDLYVAFACDFEDENLCGATQSDRDDTDWIVNHGSTPSDNTGPSTDYLGDVTGFYAFLETSDPLRVGDEAILKISLVGETGPFEFRFWYHMHGASVGTLSVVAKSFGGASITVFEETGDQGNSWLQFRFILSADTVEVLIIASKGSGPRFDVYGDIAIDGIEIMGSRDYGLPPTTTRAPPGDVYACDFDDQSICGALQSTTDYTDWLLHKGPTLTGNTGPTADSDNNLDGYYLYLETSAPLPVGAVAELVIPVSGAVGPFTLSFAYHMFGASIGVLKVLTKDEGGIRMTVFEKTGNQGNDWRRSTVFLNAGTREVLIYADKGSGGSYDISGDIAIDDVRIVTTDDTQDFKVYSCTFDDQTICGAVQSAVDGADWLLLKGPTPTDYTGPTADRNDKPEGYYLYLETSAPLTVGAEAELIISLLGTSGPYNLSFWYHMYGESVGTFKVLVRDNGGPLRTIFQKDGSQGQSWRHKTAFLDASTQEIILYANKGSGSEDDIYGDIAVDDLDIMTTMPIDSWVAEKSDYDVYVCDFDDNTICGAAQQTSDDADWTLIKGPTPSDNTGPLADRNDVNGYYLYLETSGPHVGDEAELVISLAGTRGPYSLSFWYHMLGTSVGKLEVLTKNQSGVLSVVFSKTGSQGPAWLPSSLVLDVGVDQVVFRATKGAGPGYDVYGDIAIDDVSILTTSA